MEYMLVAKAGVEFELLVKAIYEEILLSDECDTVNVEHDVKVAGKSGQLHQIDVYWKFTVAGVVHRVAVECKEYKNTVSIGRIRDFSAALDDIGDIRGIFVTTKGYQSGALKFSEHKGISLKTVQEPTSIDIDEHQSIKKMTLNGSAFCIGSVAMTPLFDVQWIIENTNLKNGDELLCDDFNDKIKVMDSNYTSLGTILDFENRLPREPANTVGLSHKYAFGDAFLHIPSSPWPPLKLTGLNFEYNTYTLKVSSETNFKLMAEAVIKDVVTGESHLYNKQTEY
jgi:hypothetical protein